ncbi:uncharacterized protein HMPREF1541_07971 [Cyphellophora europaea CBS 101466]|uniref:Pal1 cell morphology protein n=1 Tax=Cyphellophora europaea (strain CBS 101466) TaxID=1220924 RepID=W2RMQ9_CYPE1|nr:uncharacterized protein HMPREF1541_07971 [Cyphellophora europaea CBS 101466]ETN36983.1 hypothetical protein HMPREF1541_07971 [Cyphellophora europaea CBS 101466]
MEPGTKNWATEYLIDPISAPQPSEEDGPGTSFRPQAQPPTPTSPSITKSASVRSSGSKLTKNNPYRKSLGSPPPVQDLARSSSLKSPSASTKAYPSPPPSASPRVANHPPDTLQPPTQHRRRGSSLNSKFPGDMSHRPLDQLAHEKRKADRARQTSRKHRIQPDTIDSLDDAAGAAYHHGGPYDATLFARNNSSSGPLGALVDSNEETLRATPKERIADSLQRHRPLDGVATYAPGEMDRNGHLYQYEEGSNMMVDANPAGGAYKQWPGVQYHPDDIKGKGEPSYSIEKALKDHRLEKGAYRDQPEQLGMEMKSQPHTRHASSGSATGALASTGVFAEGGSGDGQMKRSGSLSTGLKKRWGSVKKHMHRDSE